MATKPTKQELEDLKAAGYVEGNKNTIPENLNPVLKAKLLKSMGEPSWGDIPGIPGEGNEDKVAGANPGSQMHVDPLDHDADGRKGGHVDNRKKSDDK